MTPYISDEDFTLYVGDVRDVMRELPDESVDCVITSPPYWGLRDYGTGEWEGGDPICDHRQKLGGDGDASTKQVTSAGTQGYSYRDVCGKCGAVRQDKQIGLERTPQEYVATMVLLFAEIRRVLAPHGTLWLNLGDSYVGGGRGGKDGDQLGENTISRAHHDGGVRWGPPTGNVPGLKPKDLVGIPWRVAFALQDDGWWLRSDNIWSKPNPMPESVTDRTTKSHEYMFMLSKRSTYFYDQEPTREEYAPASEDRYRYAFGGPKNEDLIRQDVEGPGGNRTAIVGRREFPGGVEQPTLGDLPPETPRGADGRRNTHVEKGDDSIQPRDGERWAHTGRNMRSVWVIPVTPYRDAHFATYPEKLVAPCVLMGCPERVCRTCGKPSVRLFEKVKDDDALKGTNWDETYSKPEGDDHERSVSEMYRDSLTTRRVFLGWSDCGHDDWRRGIVLDPFMGSGTTAKVARDHGRHAVGVELNEEYAQLCSERTKQLSLIGGT